jgi:hypothetical protein
MQLTLSTIYFNIIRRKDVGDGFFVSNVIIEGLDLREA